MIYTPLPLPLQLTTSTHLLLLQNLNLKQDPCSLMATCLYFHLHNVTGQLLKNNPNLLWPPKNWRRLTPDQRLLAVEFASMSLTQGERHSSLLLPERSFLIHSFTSLCFMALQAFPWITRQRPESTRINLFWTLPMERTSPHLLIKKISSTPLSKNSSTLLDKINHIPV
ncbi:hypothetical protein DPMN_110374 [Dreissena polymorpha]|uniref:Uncharacterized protein n=1 Tax=Dreissena polymorpha TaxID=45954 RepID=A0A9D4KD15_DREPO|nr:hypothetical protein DPMN_110374 [Dreissena polymorpha]